MSSSQYINDRKLAERSFIRLYFPIPEGVNAGFYTVQIPFPENIDVRERGQGNFAQHRPIGRPGSLYTYLGADSRKLDLTFNMTLDHILDQHPEFNYDNSINISPITRDSEKAKFKSPIATPPGPPRVASKFAQNYLASILPASQQEQLEELSGALPELGIGAAIAEGAVIGAISEKVERSAEKHRMIDLIVYWANIIRSSVRNNAVSPTFGPPIVRLNHGIMYQDIPCICTGYSIEKNEAAGHDLHTLLPRQIQITMNLEEYRAGNFGEFMPDGTPAERDNLAGWEAVVTKSTNSADPGPAPGLIHFR